MNEICIERHDIEDRRHVHPKEKQIRIENKNKTISEIRVAHRRVNPRQTQRVENLLLRARIYELRIAPPSAERPRQYHDRH